MIRILLTLTLCFTTAVAFAAPPPQCPPLRPERSGKVPLPLQQAPELKPEHGVFSSENCPTGHRGGCSICSGQCSCGCNNGGDCKGCYVVTNRVPFGRGSVVTFDTIPTAMPIIQGMAPTPVMQGMQGVPMFQTMPMFQPRGVSVANCGPSG